MNDDIINHPSHYNSHPSGVECITITEHMDFLSGSAMKYIWRAPYKGKELEDLRKAEWYIKRRIAQLETALSPCGSCGHLSMEKNGNNFKCRRCGTHVELSLCPHLHMEISPVGPRCKRCGIHADQIPKGESE